MFQLLLMKCLLKVGQKKSFVDYPIFDVSSSFILKITRAVRVQYMTYDLKAFLWTSVNKVGMSETQPLSFLYCR